jgi:hypothetical protein
VSIKPRKLRIEFAPWIARTRTPALLVEAIRLFQNNAPEEVRSRFSIEPDGSFLLDAMTLEATAA